MAEMALRDFLYHQVSVETSNRMAVVREHYYALAQHITAGLPPSRERSLALTHLEESLMRAIQCLAVMAEDSVPVAIGEERNS